MVRPIPRLIQDAPVEALDFVVIFVFNLLFLGLAALALWPLGMASLAARLAKGYAVLWAAVSFSAITLGMVQAILRVNLYDHAKAFFYSNMAASALLLSCWSAFAALAVRAAAAAAPVGVAAFLYVVGFLASFVAWKAVCVIYRGELYQVYNLPVGLAGFVLFALWPAAARTLYGWFFDLF
jgi:hypothetical protein